jgi:phosphatidate cytidylyltransferase
MFDIIKDSSTRIKTGVALILVVVTIGFIDSYPLIWLFLGAVMMVALYEAMELFQIDDNVMYVYAFFIWLVAYVYPHPVELIFLVAIIFASILAYTKEFDKKLFLPLLYPVVSFLFIFSLYSTYGMVSLLWLLVIVAGADVGAYFVGKYLGKTSFCETSPNKTLEGVAGGVITAIILGFIFAPEYSYWTIFIVSLLGAIASVFGDLFESYLKREAEVKDSGNILPGHGGVLDRVDGYLFSAVVMFVLLNVLV